MSFILGSAPRVVIGIMGLVRGVGRGSTICKMFCGQLMTLAGGRSTPALQNPRAGLSC